MAGRGSFSHNSVLNLASQLFVAVVALVCVPFIVAALGAESFGLLALLWMFIGYFGLLDLGVGQSSAKFIAEAVAQGETKATLLMARGALAISFLLGLFGFLLALAVSFSGLEDLIGFAPSAAQEARWSFRLLAICLPAVLVQGPLKSVLLAYNRFDKVNLLAAASGVLQWAGSALVLFLGGDLLGVVGWTVFTRYIMTVFYVRWGIRQIPDLLKAGWQIDFRSMSSFARYSGWVTVTQIITPAIPLIERSLIAAGAGLVSVTYFSVPADTITRLLVIPGSLAMTLLPVLSGKWAEAATRSEGIALYHRSIKHVLAIMIPIVIVLVTYRAELMTLWMGSEFASHTAAIVGFLAAGILFMSLAQLPNAALHAIGRPDVTTKLLIVELPVSVMVCFYAVREYGPLGAAGAWCLRVTAEFLVLFLATNRIATLHQVRRPLEFLWRAILLGAGCYALLELLKPFLWSLGAAVVACAVYIYLVWIFLYDRIDRDAVSGILLSLKGMLRREPNGM